MESRTERNSKSKNNKPTHTHDKEIERAFKEQGYGFMCTSEEMYKYAR